MDYMTFFTATICLDYVKVISVEVRITMLG